MEEGIPVNKKLEVSPLYKYSSVLFWKTCQIVSFGVRIRRIQKKRMEKMEKKEIWLKNIWVVCFLAVVCNALWGSAFPFIKIGYRLFAIDSDDTGTQILFAGIRFFLSGLMTIGAASIFNKRILKPKKESAIPILKLAMMQTVIQYWFFYMGLAHTSGVKSSIIVGTNSLLTILVASLVFRQEKLTSAKLAGCLAGLLGVIVANLSGGKFDLGMQVNGEGFLLISVFSYAFSSVYIKKYAEIESPIILSAYQFVVGGVVLTGAGLIMGGRLEQYSVEAIAVLIYLAFLSAAAYALLGILLKYNPVSKVAIYGFANPVIGVLLSALLLDEGAQAFSIRNMIALICVCIGIYIVNSQKIMKR